MGLRGFRQLPWSGWRLPRCVLPAPHARRVVVRDRRLSATNSAGYNPNETRTGNNGSNTGRVELTCANRGMDRRQPAQRPTVHPYTRRCQSTTGTSLRAAARRDQMAGPPCPKRWLRREPRGARSHCDSCRCCE
jgi:hypothetical protein